MCHEDEYRSFASTFIIFRSYVATGAVGIERRRSQPVWEKPRLTGRPLIPSDPSEQNILQPLPELDKTLLEAAQLLEVGQFEASRGPLGTGRANLQDLTNPPPKQTQKASL